MNICFNFSLGGFPVLSGELEGDALDSVYIYGKLDLGAVSRTVFVRPLPIIRDTDNDGNILKNDKNEKLSLLQESVVSHSICLLPGLNDTLKFKEILSSQTFSLQIHREDLYKRAFHVRNIEEYRSLQSAEKITTSAIVKSDLFIIQCIERALTTASQVQVQRLARNKFETFL
jgi:hypothetical protein